LVFFPDTMAFELTFIPALLIVLIAAGAGRVLAKAIQQPVILGELVLGAFAGIFIGFTMETGLVHEPLLGVATMVEPENLLSLADIGIILLLFSAGLNINFKEFKRLGIPSSIVAISGVVFPFIFGFLITILLLPPTTPQLHLVAFFIGIALVMTSIGVNAELLMKFGMLKKKIGMLIIGAAVVDDVIGLILMMAFIGIVTTGNLDPGGISLILIFTVLFFVIPLTIGIELFKKISRKVRLVEENLLLFGLIVVIGFAFIAEEIKLASIIGAFVAGLLIGQTHFVGELRKMVSLIGDGFFIPVFFVTVGMKFDFAAFGDVGLFAVALIAFAIASKVFGCGLAARALRYTRSESLAVGIAMVPRAGVELVLVKLGLDYGIIGPDIASAILLMVMVTVLVTPPSLKKVMKDADNCGRRKKSNKKVEGA